MSRFVRDVGLWSLVLVVVCAIPLVAFRHWPVALGVAIGAGLLVGDIYLLRAPLDLMQGRVARRKRPWILALTLGRIIILGAVLLLLVKFRIANVFGLFLGVTLPPVAILALLAGGRLRIWKA
jgi:hypothetical protein